jgi:hypothetical protein
MHVTSTRHNENETLYWVKAASMLELPQVNMLDSEVPIQKHRAKQELIDLLRDNVDKDYRPVQDDKEFLFDGWAKLCQHFSPIFIEKSPHHLHQWSSLQLIVECMEVLNDVDFLIIGLVRNPMDTLYSMWSRWRSKPEKMQFEWLLAYQNLIKLKERLKDKLVIIRYEDLISQHSELDKIYEFMQHQPIAQPSNKILHAKSLGKWKDDKTFGFMLSPQITEQAELFGYARFELSNNSYFMWPVYREVMRMRYIFISNIRNALKALINRSKFEDSLII